MRSNGIIQLLVLFMLGLSLDSCIYDKYPGREQYALAVEFVDSLGNQLDNSVATLDRVGCFINNIYRDYLVKEADGKYCYVSGADEDVAFVAVVGKVPEEYTLIPPPAGTSIHNCWLQMILPAGAPTPEPSPIFYGCAYTQIHGGDKSHVIIRMKDVRARVCVWAKNLVAKFGDGNYRVMIENCPTGIAYDGSSSGTLASYELPGQRYGRADYKTLSRYILPTGEMPLHVKIYREDGLLLFECDKDEQGNPISVKAGSNNVIVVQFDDANEITIKVVPFEEIGNETLFP